MVDAASNRRGVFLKEVDHGTAFYGEEDQTGVLELDCLLLGRGRDLFWN